MKGLLLLPVHCLRDVKGIRIYTVEKFIFFKKNQLPLCDVGILGSGNCNCYLRKHGVSWD